MHALWAQDLIHFLGTTPWIGGVRLCGAHDIVSSTRPRGRRRDHVAVGDLERLLLRHSGVVSRRQLSGIGVNDAEVRRLVQVGGLRRLRTGWFAAAFADPLAREAVSAGGVLTCLSALSRHGVWVPEHPKKLHVRAANRGAQVKRGAACRLHGTIPPPSGAVDDVLTAIRYAANCLDDEGLVVV